MQTNEVLIDLEVTKASVSFDDICLELPSGERILEGHCQTCQTLNVSDPCVVLLSLVTRVFIAGVSGEFKAGRMCHLLAESEHVDDVRSTLWTSINSSHNFSKLFFNFQLLFCQLGRVSSFKSQRVHRGAILGPSGAGKTSLMPLGSDISD